MGIKKQNMGFKVLLIFFLMDAVILSSSVHAATLWEKRKQAMEGAAEKTEAQKPAEETSQIAKPVETEALNALSLEPDEITIPEQYGTIIERHKGTNGKLIIHIQDAHANYEGQMNEANILKSLIENHGLKLILLEGKVSNFSFNYIRERAPLDERIRKADKLLKDGVISGVNYLNIASDYPMNIQGIEDKALYDENRNALWEIDRFKALAIEYVNKLIAVSEAVKPEVYSKDLLALDNKKKDYDNEKIDLLDYYEFLYNKAKEEDIPLYTFPNFQNLIKANELEKKVGLAKVQKGNASDEQIKLYDEYLKATKNLNINELFKEEPLLEKTLQDVLATTHAQKKLFKISEALSIMKNLLEIKVVPEEYQYYLDNRKDFDPEFWTRFLKEKSQELNIPADIPNNYYVITDNMPKIKRFYAIAAERDEAFLRRSNEHMGKEGTRLSVLIAGGFHTPTLTRLLANAGYSYVVISPKVTTQTDDEVYRSALKEHWLPGIE